MRNLKYNIYIYSGATALLIGLALYGCQHRLQVTGEEKSRATPKTSTPSSQNTIEAITLSRKRPAAALSQDIEEKKESPTALAQPVSHATSAIPMREAASMMQASQGASAMAVSPGQAATALAETESHDAVIAQKDTKDASKKTSDEEDQEESTGLKRWFEEFSEAVDDEEVLYKAVVSASIPRLVQEGKEKSYLTKTMKLVINEVGWKSDCTPLHYAAAKGNVQAVNALLRESEVVIDARTEETGITPLQCAAHEGHLEVVSLLINAYEKLGKIKEIDLHDKEGTSTLQYAASGIKEDMNREVAELLVEKGADPYQLMDGNVSLMDIAAVVGNLAMVEYCLEKIHGREDEESVIRSAIRLARSEGRANIVIILQSRCGAL